ncbi:hypothetical protein [Nocardiopsis sp. CNT312]|uniref:hypothetical protein n=1 Tax=Nocardiopsis sp. CNT312 TaxID=1137268 RepID=UPI000490BEF5|nr:hypothetical protein [Nocardiopsis sp. CNT312]
MKKVIARALVAGAAVPALAWPTAALADSLSEQQSAGGECASSGYYPSECWHGDGGHKGDGGKDGDTPVINVIIHNHIHVDNANINDLENVQGQVQGQEGTNEQGQAQSAGEESAPQEDPERITVVPPTELSS